MENQVHYQFCECCNKRGELVGWIEKTKDKEGNLIFSVDSTNLWPFSEASENKSVKRFSSEEDFRLDFPWVKTIYDRTDERTETICQGCFDKLFINREFKWNNSWSLHSAIMFPNYTDCCNQLRLRISDHGPMTSNISYNTDLFLICYETNFPYIAYWYDIRHAKYYFCELPFNTDKNDMLVCENCMQKYPYYKAKYKIVEGVDYIYYYKTDNEGNIDLPPISLNPHRSIYNAEIDYYKPIYLLQYREKLNTIEDIMDAVSDYDCDDISLQSLQFAMQIKKELKEYFRKKEILRLAKNNLNIIRKKYFIVKDVLNLIVKKCYP
jgi:hypothetical protein